MDCDETGFIIFSLIILLLPFCLFLIIDCKKYVNGDVNVPPLKENWMTLVIILNTLLGIIFGSMLHGGSCNSDSTLKDREKTAATWFFFFGAGVSLCLAGYIHNEAQKRSSI